MYWLPKAEFALNNRVNRSIGMSPFFANFGYHPRLGIEPPSPNKERDPRIERADQIIARTRNIDQKLGTMIRSSQEEYAHHANKHRTPHPNYMIGDLVYVDARDFGTSRPNKGLDWKFLGPWKIKRIIDHKAYELDIPKEKLADGLTPVFHPWKLHLASTSPYPGQISEPCADLLTFDYGDTVPHPEYEVTEIVDFRETRRWGVQYKATFAGERPDWNNSPPWQS